DGAKAGNGNAVNVIHNGNILTGGADAYGIFAQSVGGGGGTGGNAYQGFEGQFLLRKFDRSKFAKSVKFVLGGSGGSSGEGGAVFVSQSGTVTTTGIGSHAIFAQSVGGGGGAGGSGVLDLGLGLWSGGIGGDSGTSGNGHDVITNADGRINTFGDGAFGIFAQSVGGGGGAGGSVERGLNRYVNLNIGFGVAYGRGGGNGGDGGTVTVNSTATIYTEGAGSTGIMAQSVGGGGGVVGGTGNDFPILETLNFAGSVGGSGSGGIVTVNQTGNITTLGDAANGIFAQSAGGTNLGRDVTVNVNGSIVTSGLESNAIVAQSLGQGGNGNIAVNLNSSIGIVQGGLGTGAAVRFLDGRDNTLTNHSMLTTFRGLLGTSFVGTTGNDTVDNFGTYVGSVDAGTGVNAFNNRAGGVFGTGAFINLGDDLNSFFTNAGATTFGQFGALQTTSLTGNIGQSGNTARWLVDIGQIGTSDSLRATGRAEMGTSTGVVDLNELSVPTGTGAYTLMRAEQGGFAASAGNFKFGTLFGAMPLERTFEFKGTNTEAQLTLLPSVGIFHWSGANSSSWITPFVNGISNWTRDGAANYVYGTPGAGADLIFSATGTTTMGADFNINSIRFTGAGATLSHTLAAGNTLTIFGTGGRGVTIDAGSMATTLSPTIVLAGDQTWLNDGAGLFAVNGTSITGAHNLGVDGSGVTNIFSSIQIGGALTKSGGGLLILSGLNTYGGGTVVNGGTLLGDTTSLQGAFINNALVVFDQGFTGTFGSNMSGTGTLQKQGGGLLVLTGTNTYTGGTIVNGGTLMVNSNSLPGNVLNETSLIFNQTETGTFAGSMTGGGLFTKQGGGRLVLSGNSSVFGGTSIVTEGQLVVNGALGGKSLTMMPGTLLGGNGVVTATTLQGGSTLAPGNSIGALAVDGDLTFQAGAFYNVETESYGPSDWTFTSGELFTGGAVVNAQAGGSRRYRPINRYRILTAQAGIDGTFGGVTSNLSYLNPSLQYDPNNVFLTLRRNDVNFNDFGTKGNQVEVADVLNQLVAYATDDLADVVNNVYDLSGGDALSALTSMSGIIHQHVSRASLDVPRMFVGANMRRLGVVGDHGRSLMPNFGLAFNSQTASTANPIANQDYGLWITGMGGSTAYRGLPGDPGADGPSQGFVAGFDRAFGESLTFGISGGQSSPRVELEGSGDRSTADMNQFGVYGRFLRGRSRLDGVLAYSGYDNRTTRTVTDGFRAALLTSNYNARNLASQIEYGRSIGSSGGFVFEPQVGMQFGRVSFDGFDEQGDAVLALSVPERTVNSRRLVTGARVARPFSAGRTKMMAEGRASYAHDFSTIEGLPVQFQGDAFTAGFNMQPTAQLVNGAVLGAGFVGEMFGSFRFFADVQGEVSGPVKSWTGNVGLNKTW
ncbi:MAG TPA: autotransporter domain-containing protein, partial [Vicinamibacterales bacterium]|nr:autotransporter domain-containing protein [Vicinamibacterales bacterium]